MEGYVDIGGARTWYAELGAGDPVVLLHPGGAGVDARAWGPNIEAISSRFRVFTPERRGHGRTPDTAEALSFELMAQDTIAFLEAVVGGAAQLVGCSDGAIVALLVAMRRPDLVRRLVFIAGVYHRDGWAPGVLDAADGPPEFLARSYAELSPDGAKHYPVMVAKLAEMHAREPTLTPHDLSTIKTRSLVMLGDDDEVTLEHVVDMYRALADAELAVIPGTSHGLLVEKAALCNTIIIDFLTQDPVPTLAPIRRA